MRYFVITYFQKATGEQDEVTAVTRSLKKRDIQCANVILDFKKCEVVKASMGGVNVPRNFDNIVGYYRQHYKSIIDRLFNENGFEVTEVEPETQQTEQKEKADVDQN